MSSINKDKDKETQAKALQKQSSDSGEINILNLRPLPQNRPIADNTTEDTNALMGYLD